MIRAIQHLHQNCPFFEGNLTPEDLERKPSGTLVHNEENELYYSLVCRAGKRVFVYFYRLHNFDSFNLAEVSPDGWLLYRRSCFSPHSLPFWRDMTLMRDLQVLGRAVGDKIPCARKKLEQAITARKKRGKDFNPWIWDFSENIEIRDEI
jgi:hypothetical protein